MTDALKPYMQGVHGNAPSGAMRSGRILPRVPVRIYRQTPRGQQSSPRNQLLASALAHRRDRTVSATDVEGVVQYTQERQYVLRRDITFNKVAGGRQEEPLGYEAVGFYPLGDGQRRMPAQTTAGAQAARGMLIEDAETGQVFGIEGITRDPMDDRLIVIHCGQERPN